MALGFMRRHRRWLYGFLWVVIAAFIVFYIPAFLGTGGSQNDVVARVGRETISVAEFQNVFRRQLAEANRRAQGRLDLETAKQFGLPEQVLEGLIDQAVVAQEARRLGLTADDAAVKAMLMASPQFRINGQFMGGAALKRWLDMQNISEAEFLEEMRTGLLRDQLQALVTAGVEPAPGDVEREFRRRNEQAKIEYALVPSASFRDEKAVSEADVKARFEAARESYRFPERRVLSVLLVDREATKREVTVTDSEIGAYYNAHQDDYTQPEQVCASHILIKVKSDPQDKTGHTDAEARKLAEGLLAQVQAGADFAALAKKSSEDPGSAANGGDLRCFSRGQMVPEFEEAAFAMEPGQISGLVKSSFGYHIIRVNSHQTEQTAPLTAVREQIRQTLLAQDTGKRVDEKTAAISTRLRKGASLEEAASEAGLKTQKVGPLALGAPAEPLSPAALAAAFQLKTGATRPEAFRVSRGMAFVGVTEVQPSRLPELKEVEEQVRRDVVEARALEKAAGKAAELRARAGREGLEKAAKALGLTRKETPSLVGRGQPFGDLGASVLLDKAVFSLPEKTLSEPVRVAAGNAVVQVLEKKAFDAAAFEKEKAGLEESLRDGLRRRVFAAYLEQARQRLKVERTDAFRTALGD